MRRLPGLRVFRILVSCCVVLCLVIASTPAGAEETSTTIIIDHQPDPTKVTINGKALQDGMTLRVPVGKVTFRVENTDTAVYDYKITTEAIDAPEAKAVQTFLAALGPYLTDIGAEAGAAQSDPELKLKLKELDKLLLDLRSLGLATLQTYRNVELGSSTLQDGQLAARAQVQSSGFAYTDHLDAADKLHGIYSEIAHLVADPTIPPKLAEAAKKALAESDKALQLAYNVETLVRNLLEAENYWEKGKYSITLQKGRKVTLQISKKKIAEVARLARRPEIDVTLKVLPDWAWKPAVGLSLLYADGAAYPGFGTKEIKESSMGAGDGGFMITEGEVSDERFTYGLTLSLTREGWCYREKTSCTWIDLTVNPSDDVKALGAGLSHSWGVLRVGVGALWTKHKELGDGLSLGQLLPSKDDLVTRETYGGAEFYISFSVSGWQPFVADD